MEPDTGPTPPTSDEARANTMPMTTIARIASGYRSRRPAGIRGARTWLAGAVVAAACLGGAAAAPAAAALEPTPAQTEGPYYPRTLPADHDADLTRIEGRAKPAQGTRLLLAGRVLGRNGEPVVGARVELWQCDVYGRYHHVGDDASPRDDDFQGYGAVVTDRSGAFAFRTIRPVAYAGRPPHLHIRIGTGTGTSPRLTTQLYVLGDDVSRDPVLRGSRQGTFERLALRVMPATGDEPGALRAAFDFVLP